MNQHSILIVYMNELGLRLASIDGLSFHVAKEGDKRGEGHIRIVYGISLLTKILVSRRQRNQCL
jgi:hypothetical protein